MLTIYSLCLFLTILGSNIMTAQGVTERQEIFQKKINLMITFTDFFKRLLEESESMKKENKDLDLPHIKKPENKEQTIAIVFDRYIGLLMQINFLAAIAYYKLANNNIETSSPVERAKEKLDVYIGDEYPKPGEDCILFSKFLKWYNARYPVKKFYELNQFNGYKEATMTIENTVSKLTEIQVLLEKMEKVFEEEANNNYKNLFEELSKIGNFAADPIQKVDLPVHEENEHDKKDTRSLLLERFYNFFGQPLLDVEKYWRGFFQENGEVLNSSDLIWTPATVKAQFLIPYEMNEQSNFDPEDFHDDNVVNVVYLEFSFLSKALGPGNIPSSPETKTWEAIEPTAGLMDFLFNLKYGITPSTSEPEKGLKTDAEITDNDDYI